MKSNRKKHIRTHFSTEDKKEYTELTLIELRKGITTANISQDLGICEWSVQRIIKELIEGKRISQEQIDIARREKKKRDKFESPDVQRILAGLKRGETAAEIERNVRYAYTGVRYTIKELINEGYITREEIDKAIEERRQREQGEESFEEKVLRLLQEGKSCKEIGELFDKSAGTIQNIRSKFIEEGKIENKRARPRKNPVGKDTSGSIDDETKEKYLNMLLEGLSPITIQTALKLNTTDSKSIKDELIRTGKITQGIINERKKERDNKNKELVYRLLMQGYSHRDIVNQIKYSTLVYVQKLIKQLKAERRITNEDVEAAKFENNEREVKAYILRMLRQGYSQQEIADSDENRFFR